MAVYTIDMKERLQKFIAGTGITSRRKAEELMIAGEVFVNGKRVTKLGFTIDPTTDVVTVSGKILKPVTTFRYIALNKPADVTCTRAQYKTERTVYDIVPDVRDLVIAGRLDKDSEGLVVLTNDGDLTNKLTHPRYQHQKEYEVETIKPLSDEAQASLHSGIPLEEGTASLDSITEIGEKTYRIVLHQGWKRQIRRMIGYVRHDVKRLTRVRMNKLQLAGLKSGNWREVKRSDIL